MFFLNQDFNHRDNTLEVFSYTRVMIRSEDTKCIHNFVIVCDVSVCDFKKIDPLFVSCPDNFVINVGEVLYEGQRIDNLNEQARDQLRNRVFGFIFQFYHLLPELSLIEHVISPLMIRHSLLSYWKQRRTVRQQAHEILEQVGLGHRLKHRPSELSGGELQRGAIARALITRPRVLLADEPTGNLDAETGAEIMGLLNRLNEENDLTIVMVTHDETIARQAHRIVRLKDGQIEKARMASAM